MGTVATADLLLHPVRLRIVQAFLGDRALTTSDLAAELADVPAASLYRLVARLVDDGALSERDRDEIRRLLESHDGANGPDADERSRS